MKKTNKYYFSVEGETEYWYLTWLESLINATDIATRKVSFDCHVQKDPLKRAKSLVITQKTDVWHFFDYESNEPIHEKAFQDVMDRLKLAKEYGPQLNYHFGYSNLTFDLWIILHKLEFNSAIAHRDLYLPAINRAYDEHFESMKQYKHENNFKRCLSKLDLTHVNDAVSRSKAIMRHNQEVGFVLHKYKGYEYYKENPSLAVWKIIEMILSDCGIRS